MEKSYYNNIRSEPDNADYDKHLFPVIEKEVLWIECKKYQINEAFE